MCPKLVLYKGLCPLSKWGMVHAHIVTFEGRFLQDIINSTSHILSLGKNDGLGNPTKVYRCQGGHQAFKVFLWNECKPRKVNTFFWLLTIKLTWRPCMILADRYMFALSSCRVMIAGCFSCRDLTIADSVSAEAEAVNAMNGTSVKVLSPPILPNAGRKSLPLLSLTLKNYPAFSQDSDHIYFNVTRMP